MANTWGSTSGTGITTNTSVNNAELTNNLGNVIGFRTHGGKEEKTEEAYLDGTFTNTAVNAQENNTGVVTNHNKIESNTDWQRTTKTTVTPIAKSPVE